MFGALYNVVAVKVDRCERNCYFNNKHRLLSSHSLSPVGTSLCRVFTFFPGFCAFLLGINVIFPVSCHSLDVPFELFSGLRTFFCTDFYIYKKILINILKYKL